MSHYDEEYEEAYRNVQKVAMNPSDRPQPWFFTFGCGQRHAGHYVQIHGTFEDARNEMFRRYGSEWSMQYDLDTFRPQPGSWGLKPLTPADALKENNDD